jgi:hypothetical protein
MVPSGHHLVRESAISSTVRFGVATSKATSMGDSSVTTSYGHQVHFSKAIKVEGLSVILLSMSRLFEEGYVPSLTKDGGCLMRGSQKLGDINIHDGIYYLCLADNNNISNTAEQLHTLERK